MSDYAVVNPATGETGARFDSFTDAQVEEALAAAAAAFETWRKLPVAERARVVRRAAELHRERRKELAAIIVREMGKPFAAAVGEVDFAADITEYYADQADVITADQPLTILGEGTAVIRRSPLGVLFGIMPWNFPYYQVAQVRGAEPGPRQHDRPEARVAMPRVGRGHRGDLSRRRAAGGCVRQRLRQRRAGRDDRRRSADPGRLRDRLGASRGGGGRGCRAAPEEGGPGARRLGSVHRAGHR